MSMTDNELRVKIAEACGWVRVDVYSWQQSAPNVPAVRIPKQWTSVDVLPDYLNDLNAMAEAEKTLNEKQRDAYWRKLFLAVTESDSGCNWAWLSIHATARQRALAFVATIQKP